MSELISSENSRNCKQAQKHSRDRNLLLVTIVGAFPFRQQDLQSGNDLKIFTRSLKTFLPSPPTSCTAEAFVMKTNLASALLDVSVRILSSTKFNLSLLIRFIAQSVIVIRLYMKGVPKWPKQIRAWVNFEMGFESRQEKSFFSTKNIDSLSSDDTFLLRNVFPSRSHCGFHVATESNVDVHNFSRFLHVFIDTIGFGWEFALCHWLFLWIERKFHGKRNWWSRKCKTAARIFGWSPRSRVSNWICFAIGGAFVQS